MSDEEVEKRMQELRDKAKEWSIAHALKEHLEEFKKSKLAMLMKDVERGGEKGIGAQEREARANPEYIALLDRLQKATQDAEYLRWQLRLAEVGIEIWRTRQANIRAERKGYGA